jgi:hypothetical protein
MEICAEAVVHIWLLMYELFVEFSPLCPAHVPVGKIQFSALVPRDCNVTEAEQQHDDLQQMFGPQTLAFTSLSNARFH